MKLAALAVLLASVPAHAGEADPFDAGTITVQAGVGTLAGAVGGGALGLAGVGVGKLLSPRGIEMPILGGLLGFATGAAIGTIWAVDYVGDERAGANGSVFGTTIGFVLGAGSWVGLQVLVDRTTHKDLPTSVSVLSLIALGVGGAIIGYHVSAEPAGARKLTVPVVGLVF